MVIQVHLYNLRNCRSLVNSGRKDSSCQLPVHCTAFGLLVFERRQRQTLKKILKNRDSNLSALLQKQAACVVFKIECLKSDEMFHSGHHEALKEDLVIYRNKIWAFNIYANVEVDLSDS